MEEQGIFDLIFDFGETLLLNGAELKRVELTLSLLGNCFELKDFNSFVMINGIFMTAESSKGTLSAKVRDITNVSINLGRIAAINDLSRKLCQGMITPEEAKVQLQEIKTRHYSSNTFKFFAYCFGSASFCYIFGGNLWDSAAALLLGGLAAFLDLHVYPRLRLSSITKNIGSSLTITLTAALLVKIFEPLQLDRLIIGGIISLVPGVAIANGIRYLFDEDYTSGWSQMINALITALCISFGVGVGLNIYHFFS